jgi:ketosteroid isomerase-like protein
MTHPNSQLLRRGYEAFASGDVAAIRGLLADDVRWRVPGRTPLSGDYHGHQQVLALLSKRRELTQGTFRITIEETLADRDRVAALCTVSAERYGQYWASPALLLWRIRNHKAAELWEFPLDQHGEDEFWSA